MTKAVRKTIRDIAIIILAGFIYYLINRFTGFGIPCAFRVATGLPCPSCGISHMFIHIFALDFKSALADNQFLFFTWPLVAAEIVYIIYKNESGKSLSKVNTVLIGIFGIMLVSFGIVRIIFFL